MTPDELEIKFRSIIREEISSIKSPTEADKLLSRREAATYLKISLPTLSSWEKSGKLKSRRLGSRVYYKLSDITT